MEPESPALPPEDAPVAKPGAQRLLSLDVFRGLTIMAMILVNNPGAWGEKFQYGPLDHAPWFGWTMTDLIFPFFLFIVGTSLAYSLRKYLDGAAISSAVYWRILRRTALLILLGLWLGVFGKLCDVWWGGASTIRWDTLRYPGVLQRIALVYLATSLIVLHLGVRGQVAVGAVILLGYWMLLAWHPKHDDFASNLSPEGNIVRVVDRALIPDSHLYTQGKEEKTDPEGLLSNLPAIVTSLLGYWTGLAIQRRGVNKQTVILLAACGLACAAAGVAWSYELPISKKLWTSSFVMLTGGLATIVLAACLVIFDMAGLRRLARPFEIVGVNAIFVFVGSGMLGRVLGTTQIRTADGSMSTHDWLFHRGFLDHMGDPKLASLACALATIAFWWLVLWAMARRGWSVRV